MIDLYQLCRFQHALTHLFFGKFVSTLQILQGELNVFFHSEVGVEGIVLEHHADTAVLGRKSGDIIFAEKDFALGGFQQTADQIQGSTFATAGGT